MKPTSCLKRSLKVQIFKNSSLLTNFEVCCFQSRAREQPGEYHVYRNRQASADITISNLNILNLCGISGITFCTTWRKQKAFWWRITRHLNTERFSRFSQIAQILPLHPTNFNLRNFSLKMFMSGLPKWRPVSCMQPPGSHPATASQ